MLNLTVKDFKEVNKALAPHNESGMINAVNARDLHKFLEVGRDFSTWIKARITKYDFKEGVDFITLTKTGELESRGLQTAIEYYLSPAMGKELSMVENNEIGKKVRKYYIDLETKHNESESWKLDRNNVKLDYKEMSIAINERQIELGKEPKFYHFAIEADMINKIVLGMTSTQYKKHHELLPSDLIRDTFTPLQLKATYTLQKHNSAFIEAGFEFEKRKQLLTDIFMRRYNQKLIVEHIELTA